MNSLKLFLKKPKSILIIVLIIAFCLGFIFNIKSIAKNGNSGKVGIVSSNVLTNSLIPVNIKIPKVNINANIEIVGLTSSGIVGSPDLPANAAWFNKSPIPGDIGSSVIDGHFGWKDNIPAVFDNLNKIKIGDKVYVENGSGKVSVFIVRELKTYSKDEIVPSVFVSTDNKAHLNLITCAGIWDEVNAGHSSRLVVFTDKE